MEVHIEAKNGDRVVVNKKCSPRTLDGLRLDHIKFSIEITVKTKDDIDQALEDVNEMLKISKYTLPPYPVEK